MKKGKKPGEMQAARKRHLARQARQDALSKLKLGETVTISAWDGERYRFFNVAPTPLKEGQKSTGECILLMEKKIQVTRMGFKDNCYVVEGSGSLYYIREEQILGVVIE